MRSVTCEVQGRVAIDFRLLQKAKKKPLSKTTPSELGVDTTPRLTVLSVEDPPTREAGSKVADVDELITKLKDVGVI